jgi:hypothetical protein
VVAARRSSEFFGLATASNGTRALDGHRKGGVHDEGSW